MKRMLIDLRKEFVINTRLRRICFNSSDAVFMNDLRNQHGLILSI
jgi:hypothetical protein